MADLSEIIWRGCDPIISDAVGQVLERWKGYSTDLNAKRSVVLLIERFIDPAVDEYMEKLPKYYQSSILGGSGWSYSKFIRFHGYDEARKFHKLFERNFTDFVHFSEKNYHGHISTIRTIYSFIWECELKKPNRLQIRDKEGLEGGLDQNRDRVHCLICGSPTDFSSSTTDKEIYRGEGGGFNYSYKYCKNHKPINNGKQNSIYKRGVRSLSIINNEFYRLVARSHAEICDRDECARDLIKSYFYNYVRKHGLRHADLDVIRRHACAIVDARISDKKKIMLALQRSGCNQSEIARLLGIKNRQSVSKAIASVPKRFKLTVDPTQ